MSAKVEIIPSVNGVPLGLPGSSLSEPEWRQRAHTELLRQAAQQLGLLAMDDAPTADGVVSEAATQAIERLLDQVLDVPEADEVACRRHHQAHTATYTTGERVLLRHILFAVTPGVNVQALRQRAEQVLLDVRCAPADQRDARFAAMAQANSNCPSAQNGGQLGWVTAADCVPEFARDVLGQQHVGVLPRLVHSRFGLHVVDIMAREPGAVQPYDQVRGAVKLVLHQQSFITALRQYLSVLASQANVEGVTLDSAHTPLLQ